MLPMLAAVAMQATSAMPNVVLILADDVGYGDLGCYGATLTKTPNIDAIAADGIRFTDGHSPATVCTPTRYSLLTGRYSFRTGPGGGILSGVAPLAIEPERTTLPQMMKKAGYTTGIIGKWHLGLGVGKPDFNTEIKPGPREVGFDYSFILPATGDRVPCVYIEDGRVVGHDPTDPIEVSYGKKVGTDPTGKENPELLKIKPLVGHNDTIVNGVSRIGFMSGGNAARWVDEDMADTFTAKATAFIEKNKDRRFFLFLPTHDVHAPLLPHPRWNGASQCGLRGDTLAQLDWTVGEVLRTLREHGLSRNTLVVFTSDNGGVDNDGYADPRENLNGHKVNGALRGTKYTLYEGGHRVPFILSWPDRASIGKTSDALVCQIDLMASFASVVGQRLGSDEAPDSQDLGKALFDASEAGRESLALHLGGANSPVAYREREWMLVPKRDGSFELFNLEDDLGQKEDLAAKHPEIVARLRAGLEKLRG
ncbi:MAG: arylsulfatase [Fimbriimonadaceae bacterium]